MDFDNFETTAQLKELVEGWGWKVVSNRSGFEAYPPETYWGNLFGMYLAYESDSENFEFMLGDFNLGAEFNVVETVMDGIYLDPFNALRLAFGLRSYERFGQGFAVLTEVDVDCLGVIGIYDSLTVWALESKGVSSVALVVKENGQTFLVPLNEVGVPMYHNNLVQTFDRHQRSAIRTRLQQVVDSIED